MGKRIIQFIKYIFDSFLCVLYADNNECEICKAYVEDGFICSECVSKIKFCRGENTSIKNYPQIKCYSVSYYSKIIMKLILQFKYKSNFRCGSILSNFLIQFIQREDIKFDVVTFVPMTKRALKKRGYNQSKILAQNISEKFKTKTINPIIKTRETKDQIGLNAEERWKNIESCFKIKDKKSIDSKVILLVDDVITTGATTYYCANSMLKSGAKEIIILTVAKSRI